MTTLALMRGTRRRLPDLRQGTTQKLTIDGRHKLYVRTGEYEDGSLGEIFLDMHKQGELLQAFTHSFAVVVSMDLQYGVPLSEFVDCFAGYPFYPYGMVTGHARITQTSSILDAVFRHLGIYYLERTELEHPVSLKEEPERERKRLRPEYIATRWGERSILPHRRATTRRKLSVGGQKFYLETGHFGRLETDPLGEIFIAMHKEGDELRAMMNAFAIAVSFGLQYGVPLREFVDSFVDTRFEPAGPVVGHPLVTRGSSYFDCIFRILGLEYLGMEHLATALKPSYGQDDVERLPPDKPQELAKALAYRNEALLVQAMEELRASEAQVRELFFELLHYLYLCAQRGRLAVPARVDRLLHVFIGREDEFDAFCRESFGGRLEHTLYASTPADGVLPTLAAAHGTFGPFGAQLASKWIGETNCYCQYKAA